jgi:hypothetical protein
MTNLVFREKMDAEALEFHQVVRAYEAPPDITRRQQLKIIYFSTIL